jgi:hypothetical protein
VIPGVTPSPKPRRGDFNETEEYEKQKEKWRAGYEEWKDISCPCRLGYFDENGVWISGGEVRAELKPSNPRWDGNRGRAPKLRETALREDKLLTVKEIQDRLFERDLDELERRTGEQ